MKRKAKALGIEIGPLKNFPTPERHTVVWLTHLRAQVQVWAVAAEARAMPQISE